MSTSIEKIRTNVYLNADIKTKAQTIFKEYGLGLSEAFNIFLAQTVMDKGLPFDMKIPNEETQKAMKDLDQNNGEIISYQDHIEEMKQCIN